MSDHSESSEGVNAADRASPLGESEFVAPVDDSQKLEQLKPYISRGTLDLNALVMDIDTDLINEGYTPHQRPLHAAARIGDMLGRQIIIGQHKDDLVEAVHFVYESLYPRDSLYMPPMHIGTFMFRDIFLPLRIPVVYGQAAVDPVRCLYGVPENTIKWIFQSDETSGTFIDQWIDLFDFVYGLDDVAKLQRYSPKAIEFWHLAKQQLEGAAATLMGSIDKYTVIQNAIIAMELILKGVIYASGESDKMVKKFGHNMSGLVDEACKHMPASEDNRLKLVVSRTPALVERRYQAANYKRTEIGQIMMDAQFVAGEVLRQFSDRDMRAALNVESAEGRSYDERFYPPLAT